MGAEHEAGGGPNGGPTSDGPAGLLYPELTPGEAAYLDHEAAAIADRRAATMRLYRQGRPMRAIADELRRSGYERTSLSTVHRDLHAVLAGYRRLAARDAAEHVADQLQRLAHREREVELDLERSRGEVVESSTSRRGTAAGPQEQATVRRRTKYGDPRLHALLKDYWVLRCRLLGLLKDADLKAAPPVKLVAGVDPSELV